MTAEKKIDPYWGRMALIVLTITILIIVISVMDRRNISENKEMAENIAVIKISDKQYRFTVNQEKPNLADRAAWARIEAFKIEHPTVRVERKEREKIVGKDGRSDAYIYTVWVAPRENKHEKN